LVSQQTRQRAVGRRLHDDGVPIHHLRSENIER
jgi:hypothetical protein